MSAQEALAAYGFDDAEVHDVDGGLINDTYRVVRDGESYSLQRLHPIFGAAVNDDIDVITQHLEREGLTSPRIVRAEDGKSHALVGERVWRMMTWLEGQTHHRCESPAMLRSAGALVARFHAALEDCEHRFAFVRPGAHDTRAHFARLRGCVAGDAAKHPRASRLIPLAEAILEEAPSIDTLPSRIIHGDLKISNVLFRGEQAVALLDLDTLQHADLQIELGDAFRSWCNPRGEDVETPTFERELFDAAWAGYQGVAQLGAEEVAAIARGPARIAIELASRFCLDAFDESYFRWDASRFGSASEHNEVRARGQLALARSAKETLRDLTEV